MAGRRGAKASQLAVPPPPEISSCRTANGTCAICCCFNGDPVFVDGDSCALELSFIFFEENGQQPFHSSLTCSLHIMALISSGQTLNQHELAACFADLARICAASLQERDTCLQVHDANIVAFFLISWTMAPVWDLSSCTAFTLLIRDKQSEATTTF
jgi:hypothetical protein